MSRTTVGTLLLLAANLILGFVAGKVFFGLFLDNIPPLAMSAFSTNAARLMYIGYGLGFGVLLFGWSLAVIMLSRFFRRGATSPAK